MVIYTCKCLNINVHVKNKESEHVDKIAIGVSDEDFELEPLFSCCSLVQLDLEGITYKYEGLSRNKTVGDWLVTRCKGCEMTTHAKHIQKQDNCIIISVDLHKKDSTDFERIHSSDKYSQLYNIALDTKNDNQATPVLGFRSKRYELYESSLTDIQKKLNDFLINEEASMEKRIKLFEQEHRRKYAALQSKTRKEKNKLIALILMENDEDVSQSMSEAMTDQLHIESPVSPSIPNIEIKSPKFSETDSLPNGIIENNPPDITRTNSTEKVSKQEKPVRKSLSFSQSPDGDGMFGMDGFEDDVEVEGCGEYTDSEDDTDDISDSSMSTGSESFTRSNGPIKQSGLYSTSMPVLIPSWSIERSRKVDDDDEEPPPQDIAASIKAIAQSIHEDGREISGDLPRRKKFSVSDMMKQ